MALPSDPTQWLKQVAKEAVARKSECKPHTVFSTPSGSNATLQSTLHFQVLWHHRIPSTISSKSEHGDWPNHTIFSDKSLKGRINQDSTTTSNNPSSTSTGASSILQALSELCSLIKGPGDLVLQTEVSPTPAHIHHIQKTSQVSCFTTFALQLAQINIIPSSSSSIPPQPSRIIVTQIDSPAVQKRHLMCDLPQTPSKSSGSDSHNDDFEDSKYSEEFGEESDNKYQAQNFSRQHPRVSLVAKSEQTTVVTIISLLSVLQGLSTKDDDLVIQAGGARWVFMDSGNFNMKDKGKRRKIWEASADGVILRKGKIVGLIEAKSGKRSNQVRYQEAAEMVALIRHEDTKRRDQQFSRDEQRRINESYYWMISINGNQVYLLVGSWKQAYLDLLEELTLPDPEIQTKEEHDENHDPNPLSMSNLSLNERPSSSNQQSPRTPLSKTQLPHTPHDKLISVSSTNPPPLRRSPISRKEAPHDDTFLHVNEYGPYNLWHSKDLKTFSRHFQYLINSEV